MRGLNCDCGDKQEVMSLTCEFQLNPGKKNKLQIVSIDMQSLPLPGEEWGMLKTGETNLLRVTKP